MEKQISAVEWFINSLSELEHTKHLYKLIDYRIKKQKLIEQAKEMENEQKEELIKKACSLVFLAIGDGGDITTNEVIEILKKDGSY